MDLNHLDVNNLELNEAFKIMKYFLNIDDEPI